jgi:DNA polymerase-3 subunit epsilon
METIAVIDFETTGLSPNQGDRATEIAIALVRDGQIVDRYQSLMNAGVYVSSFIENYTGISNEMVRKAPKADKVMREAADFVGSHPLVAHNASFDRKFWDAELERVSKKRRQEFACSMLLARRVYPNAPNHQLGTLVDFLRLPLAGRFHRAMADAEMAASLMLSIEMELIRRFKLARVSHDLCVAIQTAQKSQMDGCIARYKGRS